MNAVLAVSAVAFLGWAIFRDGQILDAVASIFAFGRMAAPEPEPERHEHVEGDPQ